MPDPEPKARRLLFPLLRKAVQESLPLLIALSLLLYFFAWFYIWITSQIDLKAMQPYLKFLPKAWLRLATLDVETFTTPKGIISVLFEHPVVAVSATVWGLSRGSDGIAGELDRGSMELLLAQPISRGRWLLTQIMVGIVGCGVLAAASWLGLYTGVRLIHEAVDPTIYIMSAVNFFFLMFSILGITVMISTFSVSRSRTVGLAGGFVFLQFVQERLARLVPDGGTIKNLIASLSIFGGFEPQLVLSDRSGMLLWCNLALAALGLIGIGVAYYHFTNRDLPAPV